ncbi:MAG: nitroreductase family protein [Gammaproteobacteria bacterium]|jgi:nitroreductase|nr:nitroreductase family protein [Gammaproteobacteria bacterium]
MSRTAATDHPIHALLAERHSPYAFDPRRNVSAEDVHALFEAARWAMSSYNEQPWRYLVGVRGDGDRHALIHQCLVEGNQPWALNAPVLVLGLVSTQFARNGKPNAAAEHDLGAASALLTVEATARGLCVHQMIGIDAQKITQTFALPNGVKPLTALAIGYAGDPADVPDTYAQRDAAPRARMPQSGFLL